jgi:hypothetical protein
VSAAPLLLATVDLRGTVVSGGAIFASRKLSLKILQAKGDYLWMIKENQIQMYQDLQTLFEPQPSRPSWSAPPMDFRSSTSFDKGHGRLERRRITVSILLASYSEWPGLFQVFKLERERTNALGETEQEVQYGITSLSTAAATPKRLLTLVRSHWGSKMGFIIDVTAPWMRIVLNCGWVMLLICWLCSIIPLLGSLSIEGKQTCLVRNGLLIISSTKPWLPEGCSWTLQQPCSTIEHILTFGALSVTMSSCQRQ